MFRECFGARPGVLLGAASLVVTPLAHAAEPSSDTASRETNTAAQEPVGMASSSPLIGVRVGMAAFLQSRSIALEHVFKPSLQLQTTWAISDRWHIGAGAGAIVDSNSNYQVAAIYGLARYSLFASNSFDWGASGGLGVGHNAPILHDDLQADLPVLPHLLLASDVSWRLSKGFRLGAELANEQLSVVHLGAKMLFSF